MPTHFSNVSPLQVMVFPRSLAKECLMKYILVSNSTNGEIALESPAFLHPKLLMAVSTPYTVSALHSKLTYGNIPRPTWQGALTETPD